MACTPRPRTSTPPTTSNRMAELTYLQAISDGLRLEMRRDKRVFVIGEDIGVYGGALKGTQGFQEEVGPWRAVLGPLFPKAIGGGFTRAGPLGRRPAGARRVRPLS